MKAGHDFAEHDKEMCVDCAYQRGADDARKAMLNRCCDWLTLWIGNGKQLAQTMRSEIEKEDGGS